MKKKTEEKRFHCDFAYHSSGDKRTSATAMHVPREDIARLIILCAVFRKKVEIGSDKN